MPNMKSAINPSWQVTIAWIETYVKFKFNEIIKIFVDCGSLIYCSCEAD